VIPRAYLTQWRVRAPWARDEQVEQDLIISRAIVELFRTAEAARMYALRGGTALYKLYLSPPSRYSEDIDLVQVTAGPAGPMIDAIRQVLDSWLGEPRRVAKAGSFSLHYHVLGESEPPIPIRLKVEVNTREHAPVMGLAHVPFRVENRWFDGEAEVITYPLEELLGTKMRALYQRKKSRDLFDLWEASRRANIDPRRIVECFLTYMERDTMRVSRAEFEANLVSKTVQPGFLKDIAPLLSPGVEWDPAAALQYVRTEIVALLAGEPWKGGV